MQGIGADRSLIVVEMFLSRLLVRCIYAVLHYSLTISMLPCVHLIAVDLEERLQVEIEIPVLPMSSVRMLGSVMTAEYKLS